MFFIFLFCISFVLLYYCAWSVPLPTRTNLGIFPAVASWAPWSNSVARFPEAKQLMLHMKYSTFQLPAGIQSEQFHHWPVNLSSFCTRKLGPKRNNGETKMWNKNIRLSYLLKKLFWSEFSVLVWSSINFPEMTIFDFVYFLL